MSTWLGYESLFNNPNKDEYNSLPVVYCKDCLSLKIVQEIETIDSCDECKGANIGLCSIEEWDRMFFEKYKYHLLDNKNKLIDGLRTKIK